MKLEDSTLENGIKLIRLTGRLDMKSVLLIDSRFTALSATQSGPVLVDLSGVDFIASIGIRLLISNAKAVAGRGGQMVLACAQPLVEKTLEILGVNKLIHMYGSREDAIAALVGRKAHHPNQPYDHEHGNPAESHAPYRVYNIGNHQPVELMSFIGTIEKALGKEAKKNYLPMQPGDVEATYADIEALTQAVGFEPKTPLEYGIGKWVEWYRTYTGS
jgi:anti-anti-sigma factor